MTEYSAIKNKEEGSHDDPQAELGHLVSEDSLPTLVADTLLCVRQRGNNAPIAKSPTVLAAFRTHACTKVGFS